jgi:hypothetical protein
VAQKRANDYIPTVLMSNHAGWDAQWFYIRNDGGLFPPYTGRVITERPAHWPHGVAQGLQARLDPLLAALRRLREEEVTAGVVISAFHRRRVLPLMERPLRLDQMGPDAPPELLARCRMSAGELTPEEITARVKAAIAGAFESGDVNRVPMLPEGGHLDLVSESSFPFSFSLPRHCLTVEGSLSRGTLTSGDRRPL